MTLEQQITDLITPSLSDRGFDLVRVLLSGDERDKTLQIMAEKHDLSPMTIKDCEQLSTTISALLEVDDLIPNKYHLEISSPGIDRPLIKWTDFERFIGFECKIETDILILARRRFKGKITQATPDVITINFEGETQEIPFENISKAKLILTDELAKFYLKGGK